MAGSGPGWRQKLKGLPSLPVRRFEGQVAVFLKGQPVGAQSTWLGFLTFTAETRDQRGILPSPSPRLKAPNGGLILLESVGVAGRTEELGQRVQTGLDDRSTAKQASGHALATWCPPEHWSTLRRLRDPQGIGWGGAGKKRERENS